MSDEQTALIIGATSIRSLAAAIRNRRTSAGAESQRLEVLTPPEDRMLFERLDDTLPAAVRALEAADRGDGMLLAPDDALASLLQSFLSERGSANYASLVQQGKLRAAAGGGFEAQFDEHDLVGWVRNFLPDWLKGRFTKRAFVVPKESVAAIPNDARIAILGDWGSGMYGAPACAASIARAQPAFTTIVHLGDVYYAGTASETQDHLLERWPDVVGATNWALNSNHEMYSGGEGYFGKTLADPRFAQSASCFAFQNDHFVFVGLDTAYDEHDLSHAQVQWLERRMADAGSRKIVLLSHHQPYSQFESGGANLVAKLGSLLTDRRVHAWYWGHEHRCVFFDRHPNWSTWGRCVGHGGYPAFRDAFQAEPERENSDGSMWWRMRRNDVPSALVLDGTNPYIETHGARYAPNGYVSLTLDGPVIHEAAHAPDGTVLLSSRLS